MVTSEVVFSSYSRGILLRSGGDVTRIGRIVTKSGRVVTGSEDDVTRSGDDVTRSKCFWDVLALRRQLVSSQEI